MTRPEYVIGPTDRILVVGRTGSGKSTLARAMFYTGARLVVIDPKHEEDVPGAQVVYSPGDFRRVYPQRSRRVVFRPDPEDARHGDVDEVLRRVLAYGNARVLLHETVDYATTTWILPALRRVVKVGRSLGVGAVMLAQRPVGLHNDVVAESEHAFVFDLAMPGDRDKLAAIGCPDLTQRVGRPYAFLYYGPTTGGRAVACDPIPITNPAGPLPAAPATGGA